MNINCKSLVSCPFNLSYLAYRHISCGQTLAAFKGVAKPPKFNSKKARKAHWRLSWKKYKEPKLAQLARRPWDYPIMGDQRSDWKHKRWYDSHVDTWVDTTPKPSKRKFSLHYKDQRDIIHTADNAREQFYLMLDRFNEKKFEVKTFQQDFSQINMSFYYQYLTHTKYVHGLPYCIHSAPVDQQLLSKFKDFVRATLLRRNHLSQAEESNPIMQKEISDKQVMRDIVRYLTTTLASTNQNLKTSQLSYDTESSMFWLRGRGFQRYTFPDDIGVAYQCHDPALMQLRTQDPLPPFTPWLGEMSCTGEIPHFNFMPYVFGNALKKYRNTISTGYKLYAGDIDPNYQDAYDEEKLQDLPPPLYEDVRCGHTQVNVLPPTYTRKWYEENLEHCDITGEIEEHLKSHGIMSGWVWTASQAHYDRYWMDHDVTKPYCSQVIVSDGQYLSFFSYQLNTVAIDADNVQENSRRNVCYGHTSVKLYDEITEDDVIGLNEEALSLLIRYLGNGAVTTADEDTTKHDASLHVQYPSLESSDLEDQQPLHKVQAALKIEEEKRLAEEEAEKRRDAELEEKYGPLKRFAKPVEDVTLSLTSAISKKKKSS